jgi:hypothetical protein
MIDAIHQVGHVSRRACRAHVEHRFSTDSMATTYEAAYRRMLAEDRAYRDEVRIADRAPVDQTGIISGIPLPAFADTR